MPVPGDEPGRATRVADAAIIVLGLGAVAAFLYPFHIGPVRLGHTGVARLFAAAIGLAVARHLLAPAPAFPSEVRRWWARLRTRWPAAAAAVPIALITRALVILIGYLAVIAFGYPDRMVSGPERWWDLPQRWDAGWYLSIAREGYRWSGDLTRQVTVGFFPAYPLLVRAASRLIHVGGVPADAVQAWTATGVSVAAFLGAMIYLHRLVASRYGNTIATTGLLFLCAYPFAVFFSAAYTESLYLLCVVAAWFHMERAQPTRAACFGLVAGLSRPNGFLLTLPLLLLAWRHDGSPDRRPALYAAALGPVAGLVIFGVFLYQLTGHPLAWAVAQRQGWGRTYQGLGESIWAELSTMNEIGVLQYLGSWPWTAMNLFAGLFALASIWPVTRRLGLAAGVFVAVNTLTPLLNGGLMSMARYTAVLFPSFIWLALVARGNAAAAIAACFGLGQGLAAAAFFTWRPLF